MARNSLGVPGAAREWTHQKETVYAAKAVRRFREASPKTHLVGRQFFPTWQEDADYLGQRATNPSVERGAAMLAQVSPKTEANVNRLMGHQLLTLDDRATQHVHVAAEHDAVRAKLTSKKPRTEGDVRAIAALTQQVDHHLRLAGIKGTPLGMQSARAISKALRLRDGEHDRPIESLGGSKIQDFAAAIATGGRSPRQTIDTHYHDAMLGRTDVPYEYPRGLSSVGRYEGFSRAAERAHGTAVRQGLIEEGPTSRNDFMATAWTRQQQAKLENNPKAATSRKASQTKVTNLIQAAPHLDPARAGLRPIDVTAGLEF